MAASVGGWTNLPDTTFDFWRRDETALKGWAERERRSPEHAPSGGVGFCCLLSVYGGIKRRRVSDGECVMRWYQLGFVQICPVVSIWGGSSSIL